MAYIHDETVVAKMAAMRSPLHRADMPTLVRVHGAAQAGDPDARLAWSLFESEDAATARLIPAYVRNVRAGVQVQPVGLSKIEQQKKAGAAGGRTSALKAMTGSGNPAVREFARAELVKIEQEQTGGAGPDTIKSYGDAVPEEDAAFRRELARRVYGHWHPRSV